MCLTFITFVLFVKWRVVPRCLLGWTTVDVVKELQGQQTGSGLRNIHSRSRQHPSSGWAPQARTKVIARQRCVQATSDKRPLVVEDSAYLEKAARGPHRRPVTLRKLARKSKERHHAPFLPNEDKRRLKIPEHWAKGNGESLAPTDFRTGSTRLQGNGQHLTGPVKCRSFGESLSFLILAENQHT